MQSFGFFPERILATKIYEVIEKAKHQCKSIIKVEDNKIEKK